MSRSAARKISVISDVEWPRRSRSACVASSSTETVGSDGGGGSYEISERVGISRNILIRAVKVAATYKNRPCGPPRSLVDGGRSLIAFETLRFGLVRCWVPPRRRPRLLGAAKRQTAPEAAHFAQGLPPSHLKYDMDHGLLGAGCEISP